MAGAVVAGPNRLSAILCLGGLLASFTHTLVIPIVGRLPVYLNSSAQDTSWVVTATLVSAAVAMPISGRLADMYGKRRIILVALAAMVVGSVVCALSVSVIPMIVGRVLQGAATGVIPCGISLLRDKLAPARVPGAIAAMSATLGVGAALGLPTAAWVSEQFNWHVLFWISGVLAVIVFLLTLFFVSETDIRSPGRFDFVGAVGVAAAMVGLLLALNKGSSWGWSSVGFVALTVGSIVLLGFWSLYELRAQSPLVNLRVAARPVIVLTNCVGALTGFAWIMMNLSGPQLLQSPEIPGVTDFGMGESLLAAGLYMAPGGITMMLLSPVSAKLNVSVGPKASLQLGSIIVAGGLLLAAILMNESWQVMLAGIVVSAGVGIGYSAMPALIMSAAPIQQMAAANGLNALMRTMGTATGSALVATILATSVVEIFPGHEIPGESSYRLTFLVGAAAALIAAGLATAIPFPARAALRAVRT
ncbi:MFS transporter [Nocardia sp. 348MFTsu5.1]|uniref:MFS transporter n=1 Tax=Nocardia sp. 348MFTsu5.1 TaxID=1172185 RepID=UPI00037698B4|nr:MFS transporter [Nocardia sp. 348MFTsu5.1]